MINSVRDAAALMSGIGRATIKSRNWMVVWPILLLLAGFVLNELPWYYFPSQLMDPWFPVVSVFLVVTGAACLVDGLLRLTGQSGLFRVSPSTSRPLRVILSIVWLVSVPSTAAYGVFYAGMRFMQSGSDRTGQCEGLNQVVALSELVPKFVLDPSRPAVGCGTWRFGMFFSPYNNITTYGITSRVDQDRILKTLSDYRASTPVLPIRVSFYEKENWSVQKFPSGASLQTRGPEKLLRVATVR